MQITTSKHNRLIAFCIGLVLSIFLFPRPSAAEKFIETFDGNGPYSDVDNFLHGLDNPDWLLVGNPKLEGGSFIADNEGGGDSQFSEDVIFRILDGFKSFKETIIIRDLDLGTYTIAGPPGSEGDVTLMHKLPDLDSNPLFSQLSERGDDSVDLPSSPEDWVLTVGVGDARNKAHDVPSGSDISLSWVYNDENHSAMFEYDWDITDEIEPMSFGPFDLLEGDVPVEAAKTAEHWPVVDFQANAAGTVHGKLDYWEFIPSDVAGDFDESGVLDVADVNLLITEIQAGTNDPEFDVFEDGTVDDADLGFWVHELAETYFGDADLDGQFNTGDLVTVFQAGQYEDDIAGNSTWETGDWSGDGDFDSRDLVLAFQDGGFEQAAAVASVPEPASWILGLMGVVCLIARHRCARS